MPLPACVKPGLLAWAKRAVDVAHRWPAGVQGRVHVGWNEGVLSFCCVTFYSAWQANANLGSLAITMKKQPRLSSINSTLTSQLVPSVSGMLGD